MATFDDEDTQPLVPLVLSSAHLYAELLLIQRMLQILRPKYEAARKAFYADYAAASISGHAFMDALERMDALMKQREKLNRAHMEAVQREAEVQRGAPKPEPETDEERWERWEKQWQD